MPPRNGSGSIHEMSRQLGELQGMVKNLTDGFNAERQGAALSRREIRNEIGLMNLKLTPLVDDVADMKPKVEKLTEAHQRAQGVVWAFRILWGVLAGIAGAIAAKLGWK